MIEENYKLLFDRKIKYFITSRMKVGYGNKKPVLKVFLWNLFHRKKKLSYDYPNYYNQYIVTTAVIGKGLGIMLRWDRNDMQSFTKNNNLQVGDKVDLYFVVPNDGGGHWSAGGYQYVITEYGWEKIGSIMGE